MKEKIAEMMRELEEVHESLPKEETLEGDDRLIIEAYEEARRGLRTLYCFFPQE